MINSFLFLFLFLFSFSFLALKAMVLVVYFKSFTFVHSLQNEAETT